MNRDSIIKHIRNEFKTGALRLEMFPMLTTFGIKDYSETVHTHGLNYITAIGRTIEGVTAISECPVSPEGFEREIRPDSIWYSKKDNTPLLISEFERFEQTRSKNKMLRKKIENLLIAYTQMGRTLPVILLVYWSYTASTPVDIAEYLSILDNGFKLKGGLSVPGIDGRKTDYIVYHCIASGNSENLTLNQWIKVR
jgi:hypothetical protein